jgi:hypothetical protein
MQAAQAAMDGLRGELPEAVEDSNTHRSASPQNLITSPPAL